MLRVLVYFPTIYNETISDDSDEYSQLCNRNKKMDNLIGRRRVVTHFNCHTLNCEYFLNIYAS